MRKAGLDAIAGVIGQRQRNGAGRCDRAVVREARARLGELLDEFRRLTGDALHVTAVARVQDAPGHLVARLVAVRGHLGTLAQHFLGDLELLVHDRGRALLLGELQRFFPARQREFTRHVLGKLHGIGLAVFHAQHRDGGTEAQETHAVAALALDLVALLRQGQAVDFHDVVQHACKRLDDLAERIPVEARLLRERVHYETCQVHRTQQA